MTTMRRFSIFDMLEYNNVNLDVLTETFNSYFYCKYELKWPEYCVTLFNMNQSIQAYRNLF
jgi:N-terminal acetyltransferase B complex catalytic subunit